MNKVVKYVVIFGTVGVTGVVGYFLYKKFFGKKNRSSLEPPKLPPANVPVKDIDLIKASNNSSNSITPPSKTPFTNSTSGNLFRAYINDTFPNYARQIDLDRTGNFNNSYIRRAWADYGQQYTDLINKSNYSQTGVPMVVVKNKADSVTKEFWKSSNYLNDLLNRLT